MLDAIPARSGADALIAAARTLLPVLEAGRPLDAATLRDAMIRALGASDAEGAWVWKDAYEAAEAAVVLDHWLRGRKRALWLSQSDKLVEDVRRDWTALGGCADDVIPLGKFR